MINELQSKAKRILGEYYENRKPTSPHQRRAKTGSI